MKIVWLSANRAGYELLREAQKVKGANIAAVITLSETSGTKMYDGIDIDRWTELGIEVFKVDRINNEKDLLERLRPDIVIMCGWRQIVDKDILKIPPMGFIAFHPSPLPVGRGPAPIINSIMEGYRESAMTMFYATEGLDDGDMIAQERFAIGPDDHAEDVYDNAVEAGKRIIKKYLPKILAGSAPRTPQDASQATRFAARKLDDNRIDIENESITEIYNKIKALSKPYKGAYIEKDGKKLIIWRAELEE